MDSEARTANPHLIIGRLGGYATIASRTPLDQRRPNPLNIGVAGLGAVYTFPADEQTLLQGVQLWSFLYHPQAVAFQVSVDSISAEASASTAG
jgi:hypothetical protein